MEKKRLLNRICLRDYCIQYPRFFILCSRKWKIEWVNDHVSNKCGTCYSKMNTHSLWILYIVLTLHGCLLHFQDKISAKAGSFMQHMQHKDKNIVKWNYNDWKSLKENIWCGSRAIQQKNSSYQMPRRSWHVALRYMRRIFSGKIFGLLF